MRNSASLFLLATVLLLALNGCTPSPSPTITGTPTFMAPTIAVEPPQPPFEHRIGIRVVEGVGEYYDRQTGEKFMPRGNNYIRLAEQHSPSGETISYHSTFNLRLYDPPPLTLTPTGIQISGAES